jgi:glycosyltransferase involved in cell wall biosynthesis
MARERRRERDHHDKCQHAAHQSDHSRGRIPPTIAGGADKIGAIGRSALTALDVSLIIPFYDEAENLPELLRSLLESLRPLGRSFEIIFIDDCSRDGGPEFLARAALTTAELVLVQLRRNYGQTTAISAGFDIAEGNTLVVMDADLQNDPRDIPRLLAKIDDGFDVASGWRRYRKDPLLTRRIPSRIANRLIRAVTGLPLHDFGCMLKAYRHEVLEQSRLYGEMHRYLPVYAHMAGARIVEVEVTHHPRVAGRSKYGLSRILSVIFDLMTIRFLDRHLQHPMYFFGRMALGVAALSVGAALPALYWKFVTGTRSLIRTPLPVLSFILMVMAAQIFLTGLMMEVLSRTYFESQKKRPYAIRKIVGRGHDAPG